MNPWTSGWKSSEFWLALAAVAAKVIVVLVTLGVVGRDQADSLIDAVTRLLTAIGALVMIYFQASSYSKRRTELKIEAMRAEVAVMTKARHP